MLQPEVHSKYLINDTYNLRGARKQIEWNTIEKTCCHISARVPLYAIAVFGFIANFVPVVFLITRGKNIYCILN